MEPKVQAIRRLFAPTAALLFLTAAPLGVLHTAASYREADRRWIVLDPGHGGRDVGTRGPGGLVEKRVTLAIAKQVADDLKRRGVPVALTRATDHYVSLIDRATLANHLKCKLFVSVHCDFNPDRSQKGFTVLLPELPSAADREVANRVSRELLNRGFRKHAVRRDDRGLFVLQHVHEPAILVETGFFSNRVDRRTFHSPAELEKIAAAIADGISQFALQERATYRHL